MGNEAWKPIEHHYKTFEKVHLRDMLRDEERGKAMVIRH
jgi:hypothetical protein